MIAIAIAEDHVSLSDGLKLFLEQDPNIRVLFAVSNGLEMLERLENSLPDVVLTDISMPVMNGIDLCRHIKTKRPHIKVIALSMFDNPGAIKEMMNAGMDGYVVKNSPLEDLKKAVKDVYEGKSYYDPQIQSHIDELNKFKSQKNILSRSERDILKFVARGQSSQEIAEERGTAISTVNKHRKNIIQKLSLSGKAALLEYALKQHGHSN